MELPGVDDFRERFAEFSSTEDDSIERAIEDAGNEISESVWMEKDYAAGVLFLAAHFLLAYGVQAETTEDGGASSGAVKSESLGRFSISYDVGSQSASSGTASYDSTEYGIRFQRLLKRNAPRMLVL